MVNIQSKFKGLNLYLYNFTHIYLSNDVRCYPIKTVYRMKSTNCTLRHSFFNVKLLTNDLHLSSGRKY